MRQEKFAELWVYHQGSQVQGEQVNVTHLLSEGDNLVRAARIARQLQPPTNYNNTTVSVLFMFNQH